jgi:hypothetical protein
MSNSKTCIRYAAVLPQIVNLNAVSKEDIMGISICYRIERRCLYEEKV